MFTPVMNKMYWQRPKLMHRNYQLVAGYFCIGELSFKSSFSYEAHGEFEGREYHLKRKGILNPQVEVRDNETQDLLAVAETKWGSKGNVRLSGRILNWEVLTGKSLIRLSDTQGRDVGSFKLYAGGGKAALEFNEDLISLEERGIVSLLGMYLSAILGYK